MKVLGLLHINLFGIIHFCSNVFKTTYFQCHWQIGREVLVFSSCSNVEIISEVLISVHKDATISSMYIIIILSTNILSILSDMSSLRRLPWICERKIDILSITFWVRIGILSMVNIELCDRAKQTVHLKHWKVPIWFNELLIAVLIPIFISCFWPPYFENLFIVLH